MVGKMKIGMKMLSIQINHHCIFFVCEKETTK